jgi:hypothetical protein
MAAHIISISRGEYDEEYRYKTPEPGKQQLGGGR